MKEQIFSNCVTLSFKNPEMTQKYQEKVLQVIKKFNVWFTIILLILCVILIILTYSVKTKIPLDRNSTTYYIIMWACMGMIGLLFFFFLFLLIFRQSKWFQLCVHYLTYIFSSFVFCLFRTWIKCGFVTYPYYNFFLFLEFFLRLIWILLGMVSQIEIGILNLFSFTIVAVYLEEESVWEKEITQNMVLYFLMEILTTFGSYFYHREFKKSFCLNMELELKNKWYNNILNNMSNGYLYVHNTKISFINQILIDTLLQDTNVKKITEDECTNMDNEQRLNLTHNNFTTIKNNQTLILENLPYYSTKLLDEIVKNITQPRDISDQPRFAFDSWEKFIQTFKDYAIPNSNQMFVYIGRGVYKCDEEKSFLFDVSCRYYKDPQGENFDVIFNDITRTKMIEEKNAEFKYRTMFLSKIAHEFKNPIICIIELAEQLNELFSAKGQVSKSNDYESEVSSRGKKLKNEEMIFQNLSLIKAMSDYLLILIKDLDYFSENNHRLGIKNIKLNLSNTKLSEVFQLCEEIANGILKKFHKERNITFSVSKAEEIPEMIYTDEVKLKQVLINLISNAIKFTNNGMIKLNVDIHEDNILFIVSDTGKGIPDSIKSNLFKPCYSNANSTNNILGTGLGLSIVHDLTSKLGKTVKFSSEVGKGSSFWFEVPLGVGEEYKQSKSTVIERNCRDITVQNNTTIMNNTANVPENKIIQISSTNVLSGIDNSRSTLVLCDAPAMLVSINEKKLMRRSSKTLPDTLSEFEEQTPICTETHLPRKEKQINIIVADDEAFTRQATIRILRKTAMAKPISLTIMEAEDGIEVLFYVFKNMLKGQEIHCIISDENMQFLGGQSSAKILKTIEIDKNMPHVPFFLLTAYEGIQSDSLDRVLTKPLLKSYAEEIYNSFLV